MDSVYYTIFNNNKRAITLNLKTGRGKQLFEKLVLWADVVLENFSKGVMERLGIGYSRLNEINPRVIHASIKGFGEYGPWSEYRSFEVAAQATGRRDRIQRGSQTCHRYHRQSARATPARACTPPSASLAALRQRDNSGERGSTLKCQCRTASST